VSCVDVRRRTFPHVGTQRRTFHVRVCRMHRRTQCEQALRHTLTDVDIRRCMWPYHTSTCGLRRRTAPYARLTQAMQGPKHASNLTRHITRQIPVIEHFSSTLRFLRYMHCVACCWKLRLTPAVRVGRRGGVLSPTGGISEPFK